MKPKALKLGVPYKFDNKRFREVAKSCYGIDFVDAQFMFDNDTLIFTDYCFYYYDNNSRWKLSKEPFENSTLGIYVKGFKSKNHIFSEEYGSPMWKTKGFHLFQFLAEPDLYVQEEMEL